MRSNTKAEELAARLESGWCPIESPADMEQAAAELRRLDHNNRVLTDALWKACGDDEATVNATIESQGELK